MEQIMLEEISVKNEINFRYRVGDEQIMLKEISVKNEINLRYRVGDALVKTNIYIYNYEFFVFFPNRQKI